MKKLILSLAVLAAMTVSFRAGAQDILSATVSWCREWN